MLVALVLLATSGGPARALDLEMRWGHVTTYWERINEVVMSIAEHNALDFDWLDELTAMTPPDGKGKTAADVTAAVAAFRAKIDALNGASDVAPAQVHNPDLAADGTIFAAYLDTGFLLDALVLHIIHNDPVRVVGQYYPRFEDAGGDAGKAWGMVMLADKRLASVLEELGI